MHIPLKNDFILLDRMHFRVSWISRPPSPFTIFRPRPESFSTVRDPHERPIHPSLRCSNHSSRGRGSLTFSPTSLRTKTDNEDRRKISVLAWQYDRLALNGLHGDDEEGRRGRGERKIKSVLTARNFHKTIPRVLINLSCPSVQVVDCLRRNFSLSSPRSLAFRVQQRWTVR